MDAGSSLKENGLKILKGVKIALKTMTLDLEAPESSKEQKSE